MPDTKYPKDKEALDALLKEKGVELGDVVKVDVKDGYTYYGYYVGTRDIDKTVVFESGGRPALGPGSLAITISVYPLELYIKINKFRDEDFAGYEKKYGSSDAQTIVSELGKDKSLKEFLDSLPKRPCATGFLIRDINSIEKLAPASSK